MVIPTRGNVDMTEILGSLKSFGEVIIWDNSKRLDWQVYGRFKAALEAQHGVIATQDDDCIVGWPGILGAYEPGVIACNMGDASWPGRRDFYRANGMGLIGWGGVFDRSLVSVLDRYLAKYPLDEFFMRTCDRVFTSLAPCKFLDVPFRHLPHAHDPGNIGGSHNAKRNLEDIAEVKRRVATL